MKEDRVISKDRIARWRWLEIKRKKCVIVSSVVAVLLIVAVVVTAVALNNVSGKSNHINKEEFPVLLTTGLTRNASGVEGWMEEEDALYLYDIFEGNKVISIVSRKKCKPFPPFPMQLIGAAGGVIDGSPIICGGVSALTKEIVPKKKCFIFDFDENKWKFLCNMTRRRIFHRATVVGKALWITGGGMDSTRWSSEFVYKDGTALMGPDLWGKSWKHCAVTLHDGRAMVLGRHHDHKQVFIYNFTLPNNESLSEGPPMLFDSRNSACTVFNSPMHNQRPVVIVTGGYHARPNFLSISDYSLPTVTTQIFDYTIRNTWEIGPNLTSINSKIRFYSGGALLPTSDGNGVIGFFEGDVLRFSCNTTKCHWEQMDVDRDNIPSHAVVMYLPAKYSC